MADYPTFLDGMVVQYPYTRRRQYRTRKTETPSGNQKAAFLRSTARLVFDIQYPALTDAEVVTLKTHFDDQAGRYNEFGFTDPHTTTVHLRCRYGMDELRFRRAEFNRNEVNVIIEVLD